MGKEQTKMQSAHWADKAAQQIISAKGDKAQYVCASGITPSGTVHVGNFREIISVALVARALRELGKNVRFIYSWDDYDVFRKVPANFPSEMEKELRKPISEVPDPRGDASFSRYNEQRIESVLGQVGISPEYIYQAQMYQKGAYKELVLKALLSRETIRKELDAQRTEPLPPEWLPALLFCPHCRKDTTELTWDDNAKVMHYHCTSCGAQGEAPLEALKLPWRVDWPMRWFYEKVDFEPAGKDHHSQGGSFSTAKVTVKEVFNYTAPVTFQYDFVRIKGGSGKLSSSRGEVVDLQALLEIYEPAVARFLFVRPRPNSEFAVSFDLDVIKTYEDYDRAQALYYSSEELSDKARLSARIYELSQVGEAAPREPYPLPFRHATTLVQIAEGDCEKALAILGDDPKIKESRAALLSRLERAKNWTESYAPEDFRFALRSQKPEEGDFTDTEKQTLKKALDFLQSAEAAAELSTALYAFRDENGLDSEALFTLFYRALIGKGKGPRLVNFLLTIGLQRASQVIGLCVD